MNRSVKTTILKYALGMIPFIVGLVLAIIFDSYYWKVMMILVIINFIFTIIYIIRKKHDGDGEIVLNGCYFYFLFSIYYLAFREERFITNVGHELHIYNDCSLIIDTLNVREISKAEAHLHFCFKDCDICLQRKHKDIEMDRKKKKIEELEEEITTCEEMVASIKKRIEKNKSNIQALLSGAEIDSLDYHDDADTYIYGEDEEEDEDGGMILGVPTRYQ